MKPNAPVSQHSKSLETRRKIQAAAKAHYARRMAHKKAPREPRRAATVAPLAAAIAMAVTVAEAGGLGNPIAEPRPQARVSANPPSVTSWTGPYVGIFGGQRTVTEDTPDVYVRECRFGDSHATRKCAFSDHFASPEIEALETAKNPWNDPVMGRYDTTFDPVVYDLFDGVMWGAASTTFQYTTSFQKNPDPVRGKNAENVLVDVITETVTEGETYGIFAGYRHDFGGLVGGIEAGVSEDMQTLDVQVGLPLGNVLVYSLGGIAQSDFGNGTSYGIGADVILSRGWFGGAQYREATFDGADMEGLTARVGFNF